ncbi:hypothetical protein ABK040_001447 [Willaertia magna]
MNSLSTSTINMSINHNTEGMNVVHNEKLKSLQLSKNNNDSSSTTSQNSRLFTSKKQRESLAKSIISKSSHNINKAAKGKMKVAKQKVRVHLKFDGRIANILKELHANENQQEYNAVLVQRALQIGIKNNFTYQQYETMFHCILQPFRRKVKGTLRRQLSEHSVPYHGGTNNKLRRQGSDKKASTSTSKEINNVDNKPTVNA